MIPPTELALEINKDSRTGLIKLPRNIVTLANKNFIILEKNTLKELQKANINAIRAYEPLYKIICGEKFFLKEAEFLKEAFSRKMFNLADYLNENSLSSLSYFKTSKELTKYLDRIYQDIKNELVPFKHGIFLGINLQEIRRYKELTR